MFDGAPYGARMERAFDAGVGLLLADDDRLGECRMGIAPAADRPDADLAMVGEFRIGGAGAASVAGLIGKGGFIGHGAGIAGVRWGLNRGWRVGNVMPVALPPIIFPSDPESGRRDEAL
jgi:hypothetical protein